ncbi:MAG: histidine kinase N-terminal domain-containing protein [Aeriscardovia sp.]|nr:histidine kinase N-terminal domain-containing protein [Aeriscardovia sp.]
MNECGNLKDPDRILACSNLTDGARHLLHSLIADWGIIADLGYCDLQLAVKDGRGGFICAAQVRPATAPSCRPEDMVGQRFPPALSPFLTSALSSDRPLCPSDPEFKSISAVSASFEGEKAGVVLRMAYPSAHTGKWEQMGIDSSWKLFSMIPLGQFPYRVPVNTQRHNAHVPDGFVTLNAVSLVTDASPNAISCLKRLGSQGPLIGQNLADLAASLAGPDGLGGEMCTLLSGERPLDAVLTINNVSATFRSLPLWNERDYCGAVVLCREITEIRRRDNELKIKDATIAEINHRIKNNLQSVASLLALQIRDSENEEVKKALQTAKRRVQAISILHDALSQSQDEMIDFDSALTKLLQTNIDIMRERDQRISVSCEGSFGLLAPRDATPLALILSELVANAVEHGFAGEREGEIRIRALRDGCRLSVTLSDDGVGLGKLPPSGGSLGMKIVETFVKVDFQGSILWSPAPGGGTKVELSINLNGACGRA